jgi:hypothetical protein
LGVQIQAQTIAQSSIQRMSISINMRLIYLIAKTMLANHTEPVRELWLEQQQAQH